MSVKKHNDHRWSSLTTQVDWTRLLTECKETVRIRTEALLENSRETQLDLGVGAGGDRTKPVDLVAEKAIVEAFLQNDVSFTLISEESGIKEFGNRPEEYYVTVDPIDGTTNFTRGLPFYCTSIAVADKPKLSAVFAACVADLCHGFTYIARKGKGTATRDGKAITSSSTKLLDEAVVGIDLNTYKMEAIAPQLDRLFHETKHVRHFGANALELCYVADGRTDAFVDLRGKLRATDVAAGFFIVKQAGGLVTSPSGGDVDAELDPKRTVKFVASANSDIHEKILNLLKS